MHKLLYYTQAWHLVWHEQPAFQETIYAGATGPIVEPLLEYHRGLIDFSRLPFAGDSKQLSHDLSETAESILKEYACLTGYQLAVLVKSEQPWKDAREGLDYTELVGEIITNEKLYDCYQALVSDSQAVDIVDIVDIDWHGIV